jgi:hypothetical protein
MATVVVSLPFERAYVIDATRSAGAVTATDALALTVPLAATTVPLPDAVPVNVAVVAVGEDSVPGVFGESDHVTVGTTTLP